MEEIVYQREIEEYDVMHNNILGAHALWEFVKSYGKFSTGVLYPDLIELMPVLPIVLNETSCNSIYRRNFNEGSLIKVIVEDQAIFAGLQKRMEDMSNITFHSLRVAFSANVLTISTEDFRVHAISNVNPSFETNNDYSKIIMASRRLGAWFSKYDFNQLQNYLNIHL